MLFEIGKTTLYKQDAKGAIRTWSIWQENDTIIIHYGVMNGAMQEQREQIKKGKAARSLQQQIESRINSRINKEELRGYKRSLEEAQEGKSNVMGFYMPMLALPYQKVKSLDYSTAWVQMKLDGNRCLLTKQDGKIIAYSRNGKLITTIDHILKDLEIEEGMTIDGELYAHDHKLQDIRSWISRKQANSYRLRYHAYDLIDDIPFYDRLNKLRELNLGDSAGVVDTWHFSEMASLSQGLNEAREEGYEGLILRVGDAGYEDAKRSKSLLKVKVVDDNEFTVTDITLSDRGFAVLHCAVDNKTFKVTAPGSHEEKMAIYYDRETYIGQDIRVEYSVLTRDGIPFHPVATTWRNKYEE